MWNTVEGLYNMGSALNKFRSFSRYDIRSVLPITDTQRDEKPSAVPWFGPQSWTEPCLNPAPRFQPKVFNAL